MADTTYDLCLQRGQGTTITLTEIASRGSNMWTASHAYALNDVVTAFPNSGLFFRCTTAGTSSGAQPTWPAAAGLTVTDGGAVWTAQADDTYPVDNTGAVGQVDFRRSPYAPGPADLSLTVTLGGTNGSIAIPVTEDNVEALLAAWRRGSWDVRILNSDGSKRHPFGGSVTFRGATTRG